jgi:uncharacterized protein (TIGR02466 family)
MEYRGLFPTPLVSMELIDRSRLLPELRAAILAREQAAPGVQHSNDGGWQSTDDFAAWGGEAGQLLIAAATELVNKLTVAMIDGQPQAGPLAWRINAWANVNRSGAANRMHTHGGAFWSVVFYVDDGGIDGREDKGGALELTDPRGPVPLAYAPALKIALPGCLGAGLGERIYPKAGQLLVFPAWLQHAVTTYRGAGTRISVAMNFAL